jgi:hypothetical protein
MSYQEEQKSVIAKQSDEIDYLKRAQFEIQRLQRENEILRARCQMFDDLKMFLFTPPSISGFGMSPDLSSEIKRFLEEKESK